MDLLIMISLTFLFVQNSFSAWNERTNSYKNANFDIVLDQNVTQSAVFNQSGMYNLVKHVIDVSV